MDDLHVRFMDEDGPTDVLSFPLDEDAGCSATSSSRRGRRANNPDDPAGELRLLVVHGVLHVLGYDHHEDERARRDVGAAGALLGGRGPVSGGPTGSSW